MGGDLSHFSALCPASYLPDGEGVVPGDFFEGFGGLEGQREI